MMESRPSVPTACVVRQVLRFLLHGQLVPVCAGRTPWQGGMQAVNNHRKLGIRISTEAAGVRRSTVERQLNNTIKRVPRDDREALCADVAANLGDRVNEVAVRTFAARQS